MKAYKGFNKDMTCRGLQYEEGKEYETDEAKLCKCGFHACEAPIDCLSYYVPAESVYHEVELDDVSDEREDDTKRVGKKIKIGAALDFAGLCRAQFEYVKEHTTTEHTDPKTATAGDSGAATSRGSVSVGKNGCGLARGISVKARGSIGAVLVICVEGKGGGIASVQMITIDGETYIPDTWYTLKNGEIVEVQE